MRATNLIIFLGGLGLAIALAGCGGCGSAVQVDDDLLPDGGLRDGGTPRGHNGGDGEDGGDGGAGLFDRDASCAATGAQATLGKRPVDIVFVIDNSGSMQKEIQAVENNINTHFAAIVADAGIDYRVIMLAKHGKADPDESICIRQPLSGNATCAPPPAKPANTSRFFHYSTEIGSYDAFSKILSTYDATAGASDPEGLPSAGWKTWLRADSQKTFVIITDDDSTNGNPTSGAFDAALLAKAPAMFGTASRRNYVVHSICGVGENPAGTALAWQPDAGVHTTKCAGNGGDSVNHSEQHQRLAMLTGGLRFPICQYTSFDTVFRAVSQSVVAGAELACDFALPDPPQGQALDFGKVGVEYTPGDGGTVRPFNKVANGVACNSSGYFIDQDQRRVTLCPAVCSEVKGDPSGKVDVLFACATQIN
jgi:hypothetical protein